MPHDLKLTADGDLPESTEHVTGVDLLAQRLRIRLSFHRGEYLLDRRVGMPYARWRSQKPPRLDEIRDHVVATITDTPGVDDVREANATLDNRRVRVTGRIISEDVDEDIDIEVVAITEGNVSPTIAMKLATSKTIL